MAEEEEDLTRDMEDPTPEPNMAEVHIPKSSAYIYTHYQQRTSEHSSMTSRFCPLSN